MHELSLTEAIVSTVADHANGRKVSRVMLEIGKFSGVSIDALRFCFDLAIEGTALEGACLDVCEIEGRARCRDCGREFVQEVLYEACVCGTRDFLRLSGEELNVKSYELA